MTNPNDNVTATVTRGESIDTGLRRNATTKADLLSRAKDAIQAGDQSLREAADALALAQEDFNLTQREIAEAVGKSAAWVNRLLRWRRESYPGSPFGPGSRAGRERLKRVQSTEQQAPRKVDTEPKSAADEHSNRSQTTQSEDATQEAEPVTPMSTDAGRAADGSKLPSPAAAKGNLRYAIDHWWPHLDDAGKSEVIAYFLKKTKVQVP